MKTLNEIADLLEFERDLKRWQKMLEKNGDFVEARSIEAEKWHVESMINRLTDALEKEKAISV